MIVPLHLKKKMFKYKDLLIQVQRMWGLSTIIIIPVIIGATGTINKNFGDNLKKIPGNEDSSITQIAQNTAVLGTVHIIRKVL